MKLVLIILGLFILICTIGGIICYHTLAVPNRKPLSEEERKICQKIVKERKAYPFVCRQAVKTGLCPCLPCDKLNRTKRKG